MFATLLDKMGIARTAQLQATAEALQQTARTVLVSRPARRSFKAAGGDRLQASWNPSGQSNDAAIRMGLRRMRMRSREQFYNNEYAKHFYRLLKNNVIGPVGIRLQAKAKDPGGSLDRDANAKIEAGWKKWGKRGICDVTGKLSWLDVQRLALETCARDGEVLIRKVKGFPNAFGFAVQLLEADHLDENLNGLLPGGHVLRMGIEFDSWDRPVAYHLLKRHPGDYIHGHQGGPAHQRIPAEEIIHLHLPEFVRQSRGLPWLHAAMARLKKMDTYEEAELVAAIVGASKMGFYELDAEAEEEEFDGDFDEQGDLVGEAEPGTFEKLPAGYKFKPWDPQHPAGNYEPYMKRLIRAVSSGAGMSYCSLGNDLSEVNFSSIRHGVEEDRDGFKALQGWLTDWLCEEVFQAFLPSAMLTGQINLPFARLEKFLSVVWRPRRWGYVNPLQDAAAKDKLVQMGAEAISDVVAERGGDYEEYLEKLAEEEALEKQYGVMPPNKKPKPAMSAA